MKLSAAIISALAATAIAAPAPAANKPAQLARKSRMRRAALLNHKSHSKGFSASEGQDGGFGGGYGGFGGDEDSGSTWGSQGTPTGAAGGSWPTGTSSGSYGQSSGGFGSGSGGYGSSGSSGYGSSGYGGSSASAAASAPTASSVNTAQQSTSSSTASSANDEYNENWAGVVSQGTEGTVTGVSASFVLPTVKKPTDGAQVDATTHTASTWIGIDGYSCGTGLWQAGVDGTIDSSGAVTWYAWYEWYPAGTIEVDIGDLATGDTITVNVTASSTTEGTVVMSNAASGKSFTKTVTSTDKLCLADAEWIEEDLVVDDSVNEGLADFGTVTFTDAIATTKTGTMSPGDNPTYMDVEDSDNNILTSSSASGNTVTVKYV